MLLFRLNCTIAIFCFRQITAPLTKSPIFSAWIATCTKYGITSHPCFREAPLVANYLAHTRNLRSSDASLLVVPMFRLSTVGGQSFSVAARWNSGTLFLSFFAHLLHLTEFQTFLYIFPFLFLTLKCNCSSFIKRPWIL